MTTDSLFDHISSAVTDAVESYVNALVNETDDIDRDRIMDDVDFALDQTKDGVYDMVKYVLRKHGLWS